MQNQQVNNNPPGANNQQNNGFFPPWVTSMLRYVLIYYVITSVASKIFGPAASVGGGQNHLESLNNLTNSTSPTLKGSSPYFNAWSMDTPFNFKIYFSESETRIGNWLVWEESSLSYDYNELNNRAFNYTFKPSKSFQNNGTLFAHILINKLPYKGTPSHQLHKVQRLNSYLAKPKPKGKNLLSNEVVEEVIYDPNELISYWKPSFVLNLVVDVNNYPPGSLPPEVLAYFNVSETESKYYPTVYMNEFWLLRDHLIPINDTVEELRVEMQYYPMSMFKWQLQIQMDKSFEMQKSFGADDISDEFKRMILETNPYLFAITMIVSLLHTVFEFLAFKNDIQFWKNNKSMEGISVRSITLHAACQVIIFLYLLDNETSKMILFSFGFGLLIEVWKIGKAMVIQIEWSGMIPKLKLENKKSYTSKTKVYDDMAMKYLSWLIVPLVIGTSIYSVMYHEYKSWYSFIISSLVRTIYAFEFIMMTPQLFINYKLKSVSHLPWRVFMYRALNTFIDDLFAFIIKMPLMHRLSCLRDDIIFFIYLYQRWIYPVDLKRSHYGGEEDVEDEKVEDDKKTIEDTDQSTSNKEKTD